MGDEMRIVTAFTTQLIAKVLKKALSKAGFDVDKLTIRDIHITTDKDGNFDVHLNTDVRFTKDQVEALAERL